MNSLNKTFLPVQDYKNRNWYLIDCKEQTLGRLATIITSLLKGKVNSQYYPSIDTGDYVILINAESVIINETSKQYLVYNPGRPGHALTIKNASECLPQLTIQRAVKRMLTKTEGKRLMRRLRIYNDQNHQHQAQNPIKIDIANLYANIQ